MKVIANRVLILLPEIKGDEIKGGIIIPTIAQKDQFPHAKVVEVGPKVVDVNKGDIVIIDRYSGTGLRLIVDNVKYVVVAEPDILAIVNKP